jgi:hypothetical protein
MKISEYLTIRRALIPAVLSAGRHAVTASNSHARKHYEREERMLDSAIRTLDSLHAEVVPDEVDERGKKLVRVGGSSL